MAPQELVQRGWPLVHVGKRKRKGVPSFEKPTGSKEVS